MSYDGRSLHVTQHRCGMRLKNSYNLVQRIHVSCMRHYTATCALTFVVKQRIFSHVYFHFGSTISTLYTVIYMYIYTL